MNNATGDNEDQQQPQQRHKRVTLADVRSVVKPIQTYTILNGVDVTRFLKSFSNEGEHPRRVSINLAELNTEVRSSMLKLLGSKFVLFMYYEDNSGSRHMYRSCIVHMVSLCTVPDDDTRIGFELDLKSDVHTDDAIDSWERAQNYWRKNQW